MAYEGSIELISGIKQKNGGNFPLVDASAVNINDKRVDAVIGDVAYLRTKNKDSLVDAINEIAAGSGGTGESTSITITEPEDGHVVLSFE